MVTKINEPVELVPVVTGKAPQRDTLTSCEERTGEIEEQQKKACESWDSEEQDGFAISQE